MERDAASGHDHQPSQRRVVEGCTSPARTAAPGAQHPAATSVVARAQALLRTVMDPEIPTLSLVDLGVIRRVRVEDAAVGPHPGANSPSSDGECVRTDRRTLVIELMPTFLGCPALAVMREQIAARLAELGPVRVDLVRDEAWTTERMTEEGRRRLHASGFAPPPRGDLLQIDIVPVAECPFCGSRTTVLDSPFGPTPCRAIHYCRACRQPFEQFKMA